MNAAHTDWLDSQCVLPTPDRRKIWEWAHDAIRELPAAYAIRGRFNIENSPWLKDPMDSCQNPRVRRTTVIKAVQSAGTLMAEIVAAWRTANDPGPSTFTLQSIEMAGIEGKTRLFPLFESIPEIARLLPRPGPLRTQTEIFFPGGSFFILNSANLSHQQSQSVRWKYNDEIFLAQWADVYEDACRRVTAFEQQGTSHILDISQGGTDADDGRPCWATWSFRQGSMEEWSALCFGCGKSMPLHFHQTMLADPKRRAGVVWEADAKRDDGTYDEQRASETVRFVCCRCGHEHADSDATRGRWKKSGHYVCSREKPPTDWKSYHWEAVIAHSMRLLVLEYCQAENHFHRIGDDSSRMKFKQKREARPWRVERSSISIINVDSRYTVEDYSGGKKVDGEVLRAMTVDPQLTHFWVEIGAWSATPEYTQLYFGRVDTIDAARVLQLKYGVPDTCVGVDRNYQPSKTDEYCVRFSPPGDPANGWRGLSGQKKKTWVMLNAAEKPTVYPHSDPKWSPVGGGVEVPFYEFSGFHMKDILFNCLNKKGFKWNLPKNTNPLYLEHLKSEAKEEVRPGVWEFVELRQNANHGIDTSVMQLTIAVIAGIVRFKLDDAK